MKHNYSSHKRGLMLPYVLPILVLIVFLCSADFLFADVFTYDFEDATSLNTDWQIKVPADSATCTIVDVNNSVKAKDGNFLAFTFPKSKTTVSVTSRSVYQSITSVSVDACANDNGKPTFTINIVDDGGKVVANLLKDVGSKTAFSTGGTNKWGSLTKEVSPSVTGHIQIVLYSTSSGKYVGIDNIKLTYTQGGDPACADATPTLVADKEELCVSGEVTLTATNFTSGANLYLYQDGVLETLQTKNSVTDASAVFELQNVSATAEYYVIAESDCEKKSNRVSVVVDKQPTFATLNTQTENIGIGGSLMLTATADGGNVAYQWYKDNVLISGETNASYIFTPTASDIGNHSFYCEVMGCSGTAIKSNEAMVTVVLAPVCYYVTSNTTLNASTPYDFSDYKMYVDDVHAASKSNTCEDAIYRYYTTGVVIYLESTGASAIILKGQQGYDVSIQSVEVGDAYNGPFSELTDYTAQNYTGTACGELGISDVNIPQGKYVHLTFAGGSKNEFRISGICVTSPNCTTPTLQWSELQMTINYADVASFVPPVLSNPQSVPVIYSSNNEQVAMVDADGVVSIVGGGSAIISADFAGDDEASLCPITATYLLTVSCSDNVPVIVPSSASINCHAIPLSLMKSDGTTPISEGTVQWYKDGVAISGANDYTFTATASGDYFAMLTVNCPVQTSNTATITSDNTDTPSLTRLVDKHFFQMANRSLRPYTATTHYPLFRVTPKGQSSAGERYGVSATWHRADGQTLATETAVDWLRVDDETNGVMTLGANYAQLSAWLEAEKTTTNAPLQVGDTLFLTVAPANACGEIETNIMDSVPIILTNKYTLGYIVTGTKDGTITQVNTGNLTDDLYIGLQAEYNAIPLNSYAKYDYMNYEPYDLLLLTDYPKAKDKTTKPYVNALADLVDKKPILSLKAHMSSLEAWEAKGFTADPVVPGDGSEANAQKTLTVLCFAHDMFTGATWDEPEEDRKITMLSDVYKDGKQYKGIQGFTALGTTNFMNIATVYDSKGQRNLVACCERQEIVEARFVMLSVNQGATKYINPAGVKMIDLLLEYLLKTDKNSVSDCSLIFDNGDADGDGLVDADRTGAGDHQWSNNMNWNSKQHPTRLHNVRIEADCEVSGNIFGVANVRIDENYTLTIKPGAGLSSVGKFEVYEKGLPYDATLITNPKYVIVEADASHSGMLMHSHTDQLAATVQMYSPAYYTGYDAAEFPIRAWTYVGVPVQNAPIPQFLRGAYTYVWSEASGWERRADGTSVSEFEGVALSQPQPMLFTFAGNLALATDRMITLTNGGAMNGMNLIGNSWTAPIQITKLQTTDFGEGLEPTIYLYNTGRDPENGPAASSDDFSTAGQWMTIPIETAKQSGWIGPKVIPAMQAFEVNFAADATQTTATLTLKYDSVVCAAIDDLTDYTKPLYMPHANHADVASEVLDELLQPRTDTSDEPLMLRIRLTDDKQCADLYLLQGKDFSDGFDAGWDGYWQEGDANTIGLYTVSKIGKMAVSAQQQLDGTTLSVAVADDNNYTLSFTYSGHNAEHPVLYLNDMLLNRSVLLDESISYSFHTAQGDIPNRFVISATPCGTTIETSLADIVSDNGTWMLSNPIGEPIEVRIYDAAGRLCGVQPANRGLFTLNIPTQQGVYMVHLKGQTTDKVVKIVR